MCTCQNLIEPLGNAEQLSAIYKMNFDFLISVYTKIETEKQRERRK